MGFLIFLTIDSNYVVLGIYFWEEFSFEYFM